MSANNFEIEIKSLLGTEENANNLIAKMETDPSFKRTGGSKQLNHYFEEGNLKDLYEKVKDNLNDDQKHKLLDIAERAKTFSVRTRQADDKVILVVKAAVDDTTSSNGTARIEFEANVNLTLEQLDQIILDSGFKYQAKWSRERQDFEYRGTQVSVDKNAGYGYLAEFEKQISDPNLVEQTKKEIREMMTELGALELDQERLARMFDYYNNNWQDYYGTDKVFNIE